MKNETTNNDKETRGQKQKEDLPKLRMSNIISESNKRQYPNNIRYFSMFTGVGGFEKGLQDAGLIQQESSGLLPNTNRTTSQYYTCVGMSEWDKYSNQVLRYRFPFIKNWGDCTKIKPEELPDFDMLCGGVPCQSWSIAGKRKGFKDIRGTMWFEVFRIAKAKRPTYFLLENVKGLLSHDKGKSFEKLCEIICEMGYVIDFTVLNSKHWGVPQNRERVFILAIREDKLKGMVL